MEKVEIITIKVKETKSGKLSVKAFNSKGKKIKCPITITKTATGTYQLK